MALCGRRLAIRAASILMFHGSETRHVPNVLIHAVGISSSNNHNNSNKVYDFAGRFTPSFQFSRRHMSSDVSQLPTISDPQVKKAFNDLLASSWHKIDKGIRESVQKALSASGDQQGQQSLATVWSSAQAVEKFSATLTALRMELDDLSGNNGETVKKLPDVFLKALDAAFTKYTNYLEAFHDDETYLKKKVENDLGTIMIQIRQRCSGLDPKWSKVTLLGTSGLSGSYIERRG